MIMKYPHILLLLVLAVVTGCAPNGDESIAPEKVFVKYFGNQSAHRLHDIALSETGEYILFGTRKSEGDTTGSNFYLVKTDAAGNQLDAAVIDIDNTEDVAARVKVIDGGYLIVGNVAELNDALLPQAKKLFWAHLNSDFSIVNSVILSATELNAGANLIDDELVGVDILLTQNDSVLVLGTSTVRAPNELTKPNNLQQQILVQKASLDGGVRWTKTTGYQNSDEGAIALYENTDQSLIIVGSTSAITSNSFSGTNVSVMFFNKEMTSQNNAPLFGIEVGGELGYNEVPASVYRSTPDFGNLIITGTTSFGPSSAPFLMVVSEGGTLISGEVLQPNFDGNAFGLGVTRTLENDFVVIGRMESWNDGGVNKGDEAMFIRTSQLGETLPEFTHNYGTQNGNDEAKATLTAPDGSIVVGGTTDFGSGITMFTLMKMNDEGELKE